MNEIFKSFVTTVIIFVIWSAFCFWLGILYNNRTDGKIDERDNNYTEQQQQLNNQIATTTGTIQQINASIRNEIYISTRAVGNIQELLSEIKKQRIDL